MTGTRNIPPVEQPVTRTTIETSIGVSWNAAFKDRGLLPVAWRLGDPWDDFHFAADADAYAPELRRDIIEAWIAALGLADDITPLDEPLKRSHSVMIWTGTIDTITFQLTYPAAFA